MCQPPPQIILDNGVRICTLPGPTPTTAVIAVHVRSGFRSEPEGLPGLAHLFEHMLFAQGTSIADDSFLATVSKLGGHAAAHTRHNYTEFFDVIPRRHLGDVLSLEGNRFLAEPPSPAAIRNQLQIINAEILEVTHGTGIGGFPWRQLPQVMYSHWANAHDGYGDVDALACASIGDIQEHFYHSYAPANLIVSVAADQLTTSELDTLTQLFGGIQARSAHAPAVRTEPRVTADQHSESAHPVCPQPTTAVGLALPDPVKYPRLYRGSTALGTLIGVLSGPNGLRPQTGWFGRPLDTSIPDAWIIIAPALGDVPGEGLTETVRATLRSWAAGEFTEDQFRFLTAQLRIDGQRRAQHPAFAARATGARTILYNAPENVVEADCHYRGVYREDLVAAADWLLNQPAASVTIRKEL
ncbi:M16 family metallopeptidase [Corynebacterium timonense]|uniref:Predicted Zn-dependent peptidase n=1 Tax=Corynebacterium timonense TaxID=441500 RepID=A0A1H1S4H1_9CORY|nr:Predicted Zn-dependent peptidase [Corynebacterium timonense]